MRVLTDVVTSTLDITPRTLSRWKAAGCPDAGTEIIIEPEHGKLTRYCTYYIADILEWLKESGRLAGLVKTYNGKYESDHTEETFAAQAYGVAIGLDMAVDHGTYPHYYYFHRELHLIDEYERGERCRYFLAQIEAEREKEQASKAEGAAS
jgi:hypothetical protein